MHKEQKDIIWEQQFISFRQALAKLTIALNIFKPEEDEENFELEEIDELLKEGFIHRFEYTAVMAWNSMKAYVEFQDKIPVSDSVNVIREAFKMGLIADVDPWLDMMKTLSFTAHTYSSTTTEEIYEKMIDTYYTLFIALETKMKTLRTAK
jgi:nucleotidyltransferase substrate binding protein (TIGR01987 family)